MKLDHEALLKLAVQANAAIALVSWPFALFEALTKKASNADLKSKLDFRRDQLMSELALRIEETLIPYLPRAASRILLEPGFEVEPPSALSNAARDALTGCLKGNEPLYIRVLALRAISKNIFICDRVFYWLIFATALTSLFGLGCWFFMADMPDVMAKATIIMPTVVVLVALVTSGVRQHCIQKAEREIIDDSTDS